MVYPAYVQFHPKKTEALKTGISVLKKMQEARLITVDEVLFVTFPIAFFFFLLSFVHIINCRLFQLVQSCECLRDF